MPHVAFLYLSLCIFLDLFTCKAWTWYCRLRQQQCILRIYPPIQSLASLWCHLRVLNILILSVATGSMCTTLDINRLVFGYKFRHLLALIQVPAFSTKTVYTDVYTVHGHKCKHADVQIQAWCKPRETRCKWFSASQPAPGHSQTMRSQPVRDRCQLCLLSLPDHSVRSCRESAGYRPALSHTFTWSSDQVHSTAKEGRYTRLN